MVCFALWVWAVCGGRVSNAIPSVVQQVALMSFDCNGAGTYVFSYFVSPGPPLRGILGVHVDWKGQLNPWLFLAT